MPRDLLLLVKLVDEAPAPSAPLADALAALGTVTADGRRFETTLGADSAAPLRRLLDVSQANGASVLLYRAQPPSRPGTYARMWDRTDHHAQALAAWRAEEGPFPRLEAGELMHL